jgi:hypothetical protein
VRIPTGHKPKKLGRAALLGALFVLVLASALAAWAWNHPDWLLARLDRVVLRPKGLSLSARSARLEWRESGKPEITLWDMALSDNQADGFKARAACVRAALSLRALLRGRISGLELELVGPEASLGPDLWAALGKKEKPEEAPGLPRLPGLSSLSIVSGKVQARFPESWGMAPFSMEKVSVGFSANPEKPRLDVYAKVACAGKSGLVRVSQKEGLEDTWTCEVRDAPLDGLALPPVEKGQPPMPLTGTLGAQGVLSGKPGAYSASIRWEVLNAQVHNPRAPGGAVFLTPLTGTLEISKTQDTPPAGTLAVEALGLSVTTLEARFAAGGTPRVWHLWTRAREMMDWETLKPVATAFMPATAARWVGENVSGGSISELFLQCFGDARGLREDSLNIRMRVADMALDPGGRYPAVQNICGNLAFTATGLAGDFTRSEYPGCVTEKTHGLLLLAGPESGRLSLDIQAAVQTETTWPALFPALEKKLPWMRSLTAKGPATIGFGLEFANIHSSAAPVYYRLEMDCKGLSAAWTGAPGPVRGHNVTGRFTVDNKALALDPLNLFRGGAPMRVEGFHVFGGDTFIAAETLDLAPLLPFFAGGGPLPGWPPEKLFGRVEVSKKDAAPWKLAAWFGTGPGGAGGIRAGVEADKAGWRLAEFSGSLGPFSARLEKEEQGGNALGRLRAALAGGQEGSMEFSIVADQAKARVFIPEFRWWEWRGLRMPDTPESARKERGEESAGEVCLPSGSRLAVDMECPRVFLSPSESLPLSLAGHVPASCPGTLFVDSVQTRGARASGRLVVAGGPPGLDLELPEAEPGRLLAEFGALAAPASASPPVRKKETPPRPFHLSLAVREARVPSVRTAPLEMSGTLVSSATGLSVEDGRISWGGQEGRVSFKPGPGGGLWADFSFLHLAPWIALQTQKDAALAEHPSASPSRRLWDREYVAWTPPATEWNVVVTARKIRFARSDQEDFVLDATAGPGGVAAREIAWGPRGARTFSACGKFSPAASGNWEGGARIRFSELGDLTEALWGKSGEGGFPVEGREAAIVAEGAFHPVGPGVFRPEVELRIDAQNGIVRKGGAMSALLAALSPHSYLKVLSGDVREFSGQGAVFDTLEGEIGVSGSKAAVERFVLQGPSVRYVATGAVDLKSGVQDLDVCLAPLGWVDKVLGHAPGLNKLLLNKNGAFIEVCFNAKGKSGDAVIVPMAESLVPTRLRDIFRREKRREP